MASGPPQLLRRLAALLVRGSDAPFILGDLDESYERDLEKGLGAGAARRRYAVNALASAVSLWRGRFPLPRPTGFLLDVKLGLRMLAKQPALALVSVLALAVGIPASLIPVHLLNAFQATLPFDEGERIVGIQNRDVVASEPRGLSLHEFEILREELTAFEAIAAASSDPFNLISEDGRAAPVRGAEMTASAFRILRVPPLLGRTLVPADEVPGAPDVVVIAWDVWQSRLAGDAEVLGRTIRIGRVPHEVVGVMPEGFLFPVNDHLWLPLRARALDYERGEGPDLRVFGRLADGTSEQEAQAELTTIGERLARTRPDTHERLIPEIRSYSLLGVDYDITGPEIYLGQLVILSLLAVVCGNVGTLTLARTATRTGEIAVRTALGASRTRVVGQLFVESLVLAVVSTGLGLVLFDLVASRFQPAREPSFWFDFGMNARTAMTALLLAVLCAAIAGVIPALKATGRAVQKSLQRSSAGMSGIRFGGLSTALIVAEVALAVGFLTFGGVLSRSLLGDASEGLGIPVDEYLSAQLRMPSVEPTAGDTGAREEAATRLAAAHRGLLEGLAAEPAVRAFGLANSLPGMEHRRRRVEVEGEELPDGVRGHLVFTATVDVAYFQGLEQPILIGRDFTTADLEGADEAEPTPVIVNASFVEQVLGGGNPIGQRVRYVPAPGAEPGLWHEIVGVVGHLGMNTLNPQRDAGLYHAAGPGDLLPVQIAVHVGADPASFAPRLREIMRDVDPDAIIQYAEVLSDVYSEERSSAGWGTLLLGFICTIAVVLSAAGLYALMSFTVSERRREIGIRTALGALPSGIVAAIARRAFLQLTTGVLLGILLSTWVASQLQDDVVMTAGDVSLIRPVHWPLMVATVAGVMMAVGMAACVAPTLQGLRIRPVEALKDG